MAYKTPRNCISNSRKRNKKKKLIDGIKIRDIKTKNKFQIKKKLRYYSKRKWVLTIRATKLGHSIHKSLMELRSPPKPWLWIRSENQASITWQVSPIQRSLKLTMPTNTIQRKRVDSRVHFRTLTLTKTHKNFPEKIWPRKVGRPV